MSKTILITGATDGIGLLASELLVKAGHSVLLHGRSEEKLETARQQLLQAASSDQIETYRADLSSLEETRKLAAEVGQNHAQLDVLVNNAGVLKAPVTTTDYGLDLRIIVNTIAPYLLTLELLANMPKDGRVINLSSAAQQPVDLDEIFSVPSLDDMAAYAQSKLAIIMWTRHLAKMQENGPAVIALNPGSLLASKMVKEGFGVAGKDISIGAKIIAQLAVGEGHDADTGKYFDNDAGSFGSPHPAGLNDEDCAQLVSLMDDFLAG